MKLKLDENLPAELLPVLREAGHEADSVHEEALTGAPDPEVLARVRAEGRIFLTMDKGVGDLRVYNPREYLGIILFRPPASGRRTVYEFVLEHLPGVLDSNLSGRLIVVTGTGIRTR